MAARSMAQGSGVLARRTEEECRPLLLSMFRVLKELLHYCEEHSRSDLAEEVAEALSMCQADFTKLKERLNAGTVERAGVDGQAPELSALQLSPLASHTAGPADDAAAAPSSPLQDPLADSPNSNSHMLSQLETLDIEQLQARRPTPTTPASLLHSPCPLHHHHRRRRATSAVRGRHRSCRAGCTTRCTCRRRAARGAARRRGASLTSCTA